MEILRCGIKTAARTRREEQLAYSIAYKAVAEFCSTAPKEVPGEWGSEASYTIDGDDSCGGVRGSLCRSASCFAGRTAFLEWDSCA